MRVRPFCTYLLSLRAAEPKSTACHAAQHSAYSPCSHCSLAALRYRLHDADAMRQLSRMVFVHEWCYRPFEMTPEWLAVERKGKPRRTTEPWCVWGFANPQVPPACGAH